MRAGGGRLRAKKKNKYKWMFSSYFYIYIRFCLGSVVVDYIYIYIYRYLERLDMGTRLAGRAFPELRHNVSLLFDQKKNVGRKNTTEICRVTCSDQYNGR